MAGRRVGTFPAGWDRPESNPAARSAHQRMAQAGFGQVSVVAGVSEAAAA